MNPGTPHRTVARLTELKALHNIARAITSSLTLDERLEALIEQLGPAAGAQRAMVSLLDAEDPSRFRLRLAYDISKADPWLRHLDLSSERYPEIQEAVRTRQPLVIPDVCADRLLAPVQDHLKSLDLRSLVVVPLIVRERVIGALSLGYVGRGRRFRSGEVRFYQSMADLAAAAIANARLYDEVARARAEWEKTFDAITDLTAILDRENRFLRVNRALAERLRVPPDRLIGRPCGGVLPGAGIAWPGSPEARILASEESTTLQVEDRQFGGIFLVTSSPLADAEGQAMGSVLIARDITQMKRLEEEAKHRQRFEDLSRARSAFIATMSHELRNPLAAVLGFSEFLEGGGHGPLNERQSRCLGLIQESGRHLLDLINDILDVSKADAGKIELLPSEVSLAATLEAMLDLAHPQAEEAGVTLRFEIPAGLPPVLADPVRLKQILFNLLSNAVKFTPAGGMITVAARSAQDSGDWVEVAVRDTGIGIKAEDIPKLFQEFSQLEAGRAPEKRGTGLGLSLTKRLVELHGGRIWVESEGEGRGTTFRFTLPLDGERGRRKPRAVPSEGSPGCRGPRPWDDRAGPGEGPP